MLFWGARTVYWGTYLGMNRWRRGSMCLLTHTPPPKPKGASKALAFELWEAR